MKLRTLMVLITVTMMGPAWAQAADLYVSTGGSDSNSGTQAAPLRTISRAAVLAKPGTTVHVAPGTYNGNVRTTPSGTASARIRFVSVSKWGAKIIGTGTEYHWDNRGSYVDIVGFDISGPGRGGILNMGSFTLIAQNHVHDLKVSGGCNGGGGAGIVNANYSGSDGDIVGNVVHDVGIPGSCNGVQGIYSSILRGRIVNNLSFRNASFGIHLWHAANESVIMNNTVFANGSSRMGGGIVVGRGDTGAGIMINTHVMNNIVYDNPLYSIVQYCSSGVSCIGSGNSVRNNVVYANGRGVVMKVGSAAGTIEADPQFVNFRVDGSGDYRLKSTSPAIDRGMASTPPDSRGVVTYAPTTDLGGNRRPQGSGFDIGAYEFASASPSPSPTPRPAPVVQVSPTSLSFGSIVVGRTSAVKIVTIKNIGTAPFTIPAGFVMSGDFAFGGLGTCKVNVNYAPGASCTASVVFKPRARGTRTGSLSIKTNASTTPVVVRLSGTGI